MALGTYGQHRAGTYMELLGCQGQRLPHSGQWRHLAGGSHRTCQLWSLSGGFLKQGKTLSVRDLIHDGVKREVEGGGQTLRARLGDPDIS